MRIKETGIYKELLTEHLRHMDFNHLQKGGYIKINVTEGWRNFAQIGEVIIYGYAE